jgi:hypothetical protein
VARFPSSEILIGRDTPWMSVPARATHTCSTVEGVHNKRLIASMVEDRDYDAAAVGQGTAHLDLAVAPLEATIQLEDSSRARRAADSDLRTLAQLAVGLKGAKTLICPERHRPVGRSPPRYPWFPVDAGGSRT